MFEQERRHDCEELSFNTDRKNALLRIDGQRKADGAVETRSRLACTKLCPPFVPITVTEHVTASSLDSLLKCVVGSNVLEVGRITSLSSRLIGKQEGQTHTGVQMPASKSEYSCGPALALRASNQPSLPATYKVQSTASYPYDSSLSWCFVSSHHPKDTEKTRYRESQWYNCLKFPYQSCQHSTSTRGATG